MRPIFLDDIRVPRKKPPHGFWVVLRSVRDAQEYVLEYGCPTYISFDHDLGPIPEDTGYDFAKWLCDLDMDAPGFIPQGFEFFVHSANPVGAANIQTYLDNYLAQR